MRKSVLAVGFFAAVMFLAPQKVDAYPGFGKKMVLDMRTSCQTCHVGFPKLNAYGKRIKEMGYDVPEYEPSEQEKHDMSAFFRAYRKTPVSIRVKSDAVNGDVRSGKETSDGLREVQLLSAGNIFDNKVSWWFHKHIIENNELVSLFQGTPHESWLQYNWSDALRVRVGMFELPLWFSPSKTKLSELGYLYYGTTTNDDNLGLLSAPQFGIQAYGHIAKKSSGEDDWWDETAEVDYTQGYSYAVSITNGQTSFGGDYFSTIFGRITKKHPILSTGLFALIGSREMVAGSEEEEDHDDHHGHGEDHHSSVPEEVKMIDVYYRVGADLDMRWNGDLSNVYGSFVYGKDFDNTFVGGFLGYDHVVMDQLIFTTLYDFVGFLTIPAASDNHHDNGHGDHHGDHHEGAGHVHGDIIKDDAEAISFGMHYLIWQNVRLGAEYRFGTRGIDSKLIFGLQFAF